MNGRKNKKPTPRTKIRIKKDDQVVVLSGDDRGKQGRVLAVFHDTRRVLVEGVNMVKKHQKPTPKNQTGGIVEQEAPVHVSNLKVI